MSGIIGVSPNMKSGVVGKYPVGHVLQTTSVTQGTSETTVATGNWAGGTVVSADITPSNANNSILLFADFGVYVNNSAGDAAYIFRIKKDHSGGTSYPPSMDDQDSGNIGTAYLNIDPGDQQESYYVTYQDPAGGVTTAITYSVDLYAHNLDTLTVGGPNGRQWRIWFQEIQR